MFLASSALNTLGSQPRSRRSAWALGSGVYSSPEKQSSWTASEAVRMAEVQQAVSFRATPLPSEDRVHFSVVVLVAELPGELRIFREIFRAGRQATEPAWQLELRERTHQLLSICNDPFVLFPV